MGLFPLSLPRRRAKENGAPERPESFYLGPPLLVAAVVDRIDGIGDAVAILVAPCLVTAVVILIGAIGNAVAVLVPAAGLVAPAFATILAVALPTIGYVAITRTPLLPSAWCPDVLVIDQSIGARRPDITGTGAGTTS